MSDDEKDIVAKALEITDEELLNPEGADTTLAPMEGFYLIPDVDIYPGVNNLTKMKEVYREFMKGGELEKIAEDYDVNHRTALKWVDYGQWMKRRSRVEHAALEEEQQGIEILRLQHRKFTLKRQIASSEQLRKRLDEALEESESHFTPLQLKQLSEANKANADVEVRALGLNESGLSAIQQKDKATADSENRRPLVLLVPGGGLPNATRSEKTIPVEDVIEITEK